MPLMAQLAWPHVRVSVVRGGHLIVTLAVAVVAWLGLSALASPFVRADIPLVGQVFVVNPQGQGTLPVRYVERVAALPGAGDISYQNVSPVICQSPSVTATLNGFAGAGTNRQLAESGIDPATVEAWEKDPLGILVGSTLAERCGWKAGLDVEPMGITGQPVRVHVVGVFTSSKPAENQIAFAHFEYLNRLPGLYGTRDHANVITAYSTDVHRNGELAARIEAEFAHDDPPVEAMTNTTADNGLARFGRIQNLLAWIMLAVFACTAMVLASTLAHTIAQRRAQMAVLQVLGFRRGQLLGSFMIECICVLVAGTLFGIAAGRGVIHLIAPRIAPILGQFAPPGWAYACLPLWLLALLAVSLVLPVSIVVRSRPTDFQAT